MSPDPYDSPVEGYCPACGSEAIYLSFGRVTCFQKGCPQPQAAAMVLSDPEIHHIVRVDALGYFNSKHPLIERVNDELLDCTIHDAVMEWVGIPTYKRKQEIANTVWRVKRISGDVDDTFEWEQLL